MTEAIGKVEKPSVEQFSHGRRLFLVPLVFDAVEPPQEYQALFNRYWQQAAEQVGNLAGKLGEVKRVYHELIAAGGEEGLKMLQELNQGSYKIVKVAVDKGAQLEPVEDAELLGEFMDWGRCLSIGLHSQKVFTTIYQAYTEVGKKRNEHLIKRIDETLKPEEIGMLFIREGHHLQFPADIQVFYVAPPALDELHRWLREAEAKEEETHEHTHEHHTHEH